MRGINITGETMIFKNDYGYSTTISHKNLNGEYEKMYVSVQFPKDKIVDNKSVIQITKGFLSFYKDKNGLDKIKLIVQEYGVVGTEDFEQYDDLPF